MIRLYTAAIVITLSAFGCQSSTPKELPILGHAQISEGDTSYHVIRPFQFINQDSQIVNNQLLTESIYIADFFFTHCPTICPKVTRQMLRINDRFLNDPSVKLVSFSLDPKRDTIARLQEYATKLGVTSSKWHFLHGNKMEIYDLAEDYFSIALNDDEAPGGINHSGKLILIDGQGRVRSYCEGTIEQEVTKFMDDIQILLDSDK